MLGWRLFDIVSVNDQKRLIKEQLAWTRNTMASCIQRWLMCGGSPRLHQTNPFLFAISLTEHKIKPKKSRRNTNGILRVEGFWLWGGWWKDLSPNLQSNDFAETKPVFTQSNTHCTSLQSLRICLTQTAGGAVAVPLCREEVWMLVSLYLSTSWLHTYINLNKFIQPLSTSFWNSVSKQNNNKSKRA